MEPGTRRHPTDAVIETRGLRKQFGRKIAVAELSLSVGRGEIFGFLGPNGAGKTTSLKMLLGLIAPSGGTATVLGAPIGDRPARARVGFLPEHFRFQEWLHGRELLRFHGRLYGLSGTRLEARIEELLARVDLLDAAARPLREYSKGMLQRIGLAQALIQEPRLLVLDEPTAGVDPAGSRQICDLILKFRQQGITVLLCSHLLSMVQEICDRIGIMHRGELVREGKLDDLISIENQTELVLENAPPELLADLRSRIASSGARLVAEQKPQQNLERYFLDVTKDNGKR